MVKDGEKRQFRLRKGGAFKVPIGAVIRIVSVERGEATVEVTYAAPELLGRAEIDAEKSAG